MYNPVELSRIDRQIEDLQRLKANYQNMPQPINNIITKCIYSPIKKPINLNCQIIKNLKKSPIKKPKIKNNYI